MSEDAYVCSTCGSQDVTLLDDYSDDPKYCCGIIYEENEDICASCGEPL